VFNQFDEFGNYLWHYEITGHAMEEVLQEVMGPNDEYRGVTLTTGSAGTIGCGDYMKQLFPASINVAGEALQCPTLLENGFGAHRIEGIGDKHVPWIHNVKNTDMIMAIDDNTVVNLARLFNEPAGRKYLKKIGVPDKLVDQLDLLGFSSIANTVMAIKMAKYYEMDENDIILTVWTDSMELYESRLQEMHAEIGDYKEMDAAQTHAMYICGLTPNYLEDLTYQDQRRVHNLKYFTWVEQQGRGVDELRALWSEDFWPEVFSEVDHWDELVRQFNERTGLLSSL
jgi:hypothetical protein